MPDSLAARCAIYASLNHDFPYLFPVDSALSAFAGFIEVLGEEYHVWIDHTGSRCAVDSRAQQLLSDETNLSHRLKTCVTVHDFLLDLRDTLERHSSSSSSSLKLSNSTLTQPHLPSTTYYNTLLGHLSTIGWSNVCSLDERLRIVGLVYEDDGGRRHELKLTLANNYPHTFPSVDMTLPIVSFAAHTASLPQLYHHFITCVRSFQRLFDSLDDFDNNTVVLEPQYPTRRDTHRRISLSQTNAVASIYISLDIKDPVTAYPKCRLLGPERVTAPLRQALNQRMHLWDTSGDVLPRENLEHVLDVRFPAKGAKSGSEQAGDDGEESIGQCGICYDSRRDQCVSDVACERDGCNVMYHRLCLVEWLRSLPDTKDSFDTLTGKCVYCEHSISVSTKQTY